MTFRAVVAYPSCQPGPQLPASAECLDVNALILERTPEPLDEDIVHTGGLVIQRDLDIHRKRTSTNRGLVNWLP